MIAKRSCRPAPAIRSSVVVRVERIEPGLRAPAPGRARGAGAADRDGFAQIIFAHQHATGRPCPDRPVIVEVVDAIARAPPDAAVLSGRWRYRCCRLFGRWPATKRARTARAAPRRQLRQDCGNARVGGSRFIRPPSVRNHGIRRAQSGEGSSGLRERPDIGPELS